MRGNGSAELSLQAEGLNCSHAPVGRRPASWSVCIFGAGCSGRRTAPWLQRLRIYEAASGLPAEGLSGTPPQLTRTELCGRWNALSPTRWPKWLSNTSEASSCTAAGLSDTPEQPTRTRHVLTCTAEKLSDTPEQLTRTAEEQSCTAEKLTCTTQEQNLDTEELNRTPGKQNLKIE
jgi:hypothetical protein